MVMEKRKGTFHCSQKKVSLGKNESEWIPVLLCKALFCISHTWGWAVGRAWLDRSEVNLFLFWKIFPMCITEFILGNPLLLHKCIPIKCFAIGILILSSHTIGKCISFLRKPMMWKWRGKAQCLQGQTDIFQKLAHCFNLYRLQIHKMYKKV